MQEKRVRTDSPKDSAHRRLYFPQVDIHLGVAALLAVILQLLAIFGPFGSEDLPRRVLFVTSYLVLFVFVGANLRRPGVLILGLGIVCNFLVIVANGGFMPTTVADFGKQGPLPADARLGEWVPQTKDILLDPQDVHLYFLGDHLYIGGQRIIRIFSIGDVIIAAGLIVTLAEVLTPRFRPRNEQNGA